MRNRALRRREPEVPRAKLADDRALLRKADDATAIAQREGSGHGHRADAAEVHEDDEIKSQEELTQTKVAISIADVKGNDEANGKDIADLKQVVTQAEPAEEQVFDMVEQMPTFPGGTTELMKYIGEHLKYPPIAAENGTQGKVICRFVIGKDGQVRDVTIARSLDPYCDKEAIRVIKSMPKWIPGKQNGKAVAVNFTVPIVFKLQ